jgi:putative oxidoreductase
MSTLVRLYRHLIAVGNSLQTPLLLIVRLYWGIQMSQTGWGKLHSLDRVTNFFTSLGIPAPGLSAVFIALLEFVGGILFALGLGSRLIAALFVGDMLVAYVTADREAFTSFLSDPDAFAHAAPFVYLVAALIVLAAGPGKASVDALLAPRFKND